MAKQDSFGWQQNVVSLNPTLSYSFLTNFDFSQLSDSSQPKQLADKPVLLCLHGWLDNAASFTPLAAFFDGYHIIALELAGHGYSSHRPEFSHYHLVDWVYDLYLLVDKLNLPAFYLLGHSMGGMIASVYTALKQDKVKKLILLESSAAFTSNADALVDNMQAAFESRLQLEKSTPDSDSANNKNNRKMRSLKSLPGLIQARARMSDLTDALAGLLIERNIELLADGFIWRSDPRVKTLSPIRLDEAQAKAYIEAIQVDCLVVLALNGYPSIARAIYNRQTYFKQLEIQRLAGGHHFHMQNPAELAALIKRFIAD
ncbi:alpha/beta hydrolase [Catenovulum sp. 2E275]|uniref:alpha/beta fold hydrolase n=1 Tax=Catenovulum sp. 2E275 TaxID=2980497 RepID=UPI0021D34748|nr:alpha/beta hydrolase [Catenovulum sp. 2E275]MCU4676975.1 alpha/beta hydrolase [Catenovulum sp. 2E275]